MTLLVEALVYVAVGIALLSTWLMLRMRDEYQMMHYMAAPASISATLITVAVFIQQGVKPESFKALFVTGVLVVMNAVATHATARAFRIRQTKRSQAPEDEEVPQLPGDEPVAPGERKVP